jgi:hypothetical protein
MSKNNKPQPRAQAALVTDDTQLDQAGTDDSADHEDESDDVVAAPASISLDDEPEEYQPRGNSNTLFQSAEARARALEAAGAAKDSDELIDAATGLPYTKAVQPRKAAVKMTTVRPNQNVTRFFFGGATYQLNKGKKQVVPEHLAIVLEEKGYV